MAEEKKADTLEGILSLASGGLFGYTGLHAGLNYLAPLVTNEAVNYLSYSVSSFLGLGAAIGLGAAGAYAGYVGARFVYKKLLKPVGAKLFSAVYGLEKAICSLFGFGKSNTPEGG